MSIPLTDRTALLRNRARARRNPVTFLQDIAVDEVKDRLMLVNKSFKKVAIVTGFPEIWQSAFDSPLCIEDEDTLPLPEKEFDLVVHAMCLHWANDPVGQLIQCRRALQPDGLFLGLMFGGETLFQLRAAMAQAESDISGGLSPRVAPMGEIRDLGALLQRAGFALPVADGLPLDISYPSPLTLMRELRGMGEGNALSTRARNRLRRDILQRACDIYAQNYALDNGRITARFDIITLTGWAPDPAQPQPLRPGSATNRLAEALKVPETPLKD